MKFTSELRLARLASNDVMHGGTRAWRLAHRMHAITGSMEGQQIVQRVYLRPGGKGVFTCRICGTPFLTAYEENSCCEGMKSYLGEVWLAD